jgi:hypothetical protein
MQQPCKKCGFVSPEMDLFCRQCGMQLAVETELSSAATLNYGRMEPAVAVAGTGRLPSGVGEAAVADTIRYYAAPQYAAPPATPAPPPPPRASRFDAVARFMKGVFFFLLFAGLLAATASAVFFSKEASDERQRRWELEERAERRNNANGRAQDAWEQMQDAVKLIREAEEKAAGAGASLAGSAEKPVDLEKFAYPGAQTEAKVSNFGSQSLSQITSDKLATVREHYERQLGKAVIQTQDQNYAQPHEQPHEKLLFHSFPVLIRVEKGERNQVKITIFHSLLRFPSS